MLRLCNGRNVSGLFVLVVANLTFAQAPPPAAHDRQDYVAGKPFQIGDQWVREARSVVLAVPSAIVPAERNFLLNPAHPDFRKVRQHKPVEFAFDARLVGR